MDVEGSFGVSKKLEKAVVFNVLLLRSATRSVHVYSVARSQRRSLCFYECRIWTYLVMDLLAVLPLLLRLRYVDSPGCVLADASAVACQCLVNMSKLKHVCKAKVLIRLRNHQGLSCSNDIKI